MKSIFLVLFIITGLLISSSSVFAYEANPTHQNLTRKIIEVYNKYYTPKIPDQYIEYIIQGSIEEDASPRWINHFYDPTTQKGWTGEKQGYLKQEDTVRLSKIFLSSEKAVSAKDWIHNKSLQKDYGFYKGNQTYDMATEDVGFVLAKKEKLVDNLLSHQTAENGYKALGHVLHNLEDMGVPAHVRNDSHGDIANDEGDPYEIWASEGNNSDLGFLDNLNPGNEKFGCNKIDDCFEALAKYTHDNFYSKDTIEESAKIYPEIDSNNKNIATKKDNFGNKVYLGVILDNKILIKKEYGSIHQSYYNLLARQTVLAGVGTIFGFYKDVDIIKEYVAPYPKKAIQYKDIKEPGSFFSFYGTLEQIKNFYQNTANKVKEIAQKGANKTKETVKKASQAIKNVFASSNNQKEGFTQLAQIIPTADIQTHNPEPIINKPEPQKLTNQNNTNEIRQLKKELANLKKEIRDIKQENKKPVINDPVKIKIAKETKEEKPEKPIEEKKIAKAETSNQEPAINNSKEFCKFNNIGSFSKDEIVINEIAWMGSKTSPSDEWIELKNTGAQPIDIKDWQLISKNNDIEIDLNKLQSTIIKPGEFILLERTDNNSAKEAKADLIYKGALSNTNEGLRLFKKGCNMTDEVIATPNWPAGDNSEKRTMERNLGDAGWHTSEKVGGTPKKENSQAIFMSFGGGEIKKTIEPAESKKENTTSSLPLVASTTPKILISQIQLASTESANDEFVKIYNPNGSDIDLTNWYIQKKTKTADNFSTFAKAELFQNKLIKAKEFLTIGNAKYKEFKDIENNYGISLNNVLAVKNPQGIVMDKVGWGEAKDCQGACIPNPKNNQKIQRKYFDNQYLDTKDNNNDFELIDNTTTTITMPQLATSSLLIGGIGGFDLLTSSSSLGFDLTLTSSTASSTITPPTINNFSISFSSSTKEAIFNWDLINSSSTDQFTYKITDISSSTNKLPPLETSATLAREIISEFEREYNFKLEVLDKDKNMVASTSKNIVIDKIIPIIDLKQLDETVKSGDFQAFGFVKYLGDVSGVVSNLEIYGESSLSGKWKAGLCANMSSVVYDWHQCVSNNFYEVESNENVATSTKTLITFNFDKKPELLSGGRYGFYVAPPYPAFGAVYGTPQAGYFAKVIAYANDGHGFGWADYSPKINDLYYVLK